MEPSYLKVLEKSSLSIVSQIELPHVEYKHQERINVHARTHVQLLAHWVWWRLPLCRNTLSVQNCQFGEHSNVSILKTKSLLKKRNAIGKVPTIVVGVLDNLETTSGCGAGFSDIHICKADSLLGTTVDNRSQGNNKKFCFYISVLKDFSKRIRIREISLGSSQIETLVIEKDHHVTSAV